MQGAVAKASTGFWAPRSRGLLTRTTALEASGPTEHPTLAYAVVATSDERITRGSWSDCTSMPLGFKDLMEKDAMRL